MEEQTPPRQVGKGLKTGLLVFALVVMLGLGYGLGKGTLTFGRLKDKVSEQNTSSIDFTSVQELYDALKKQYDGQLDDTVLLEGIKQGLASASGDPYTEYFNAEGAKEFTDELQGEFTGIGAELGKEDKTIVIIAPIAGFPAEKAGLRPKDVIVEINGESAYDMSISEAVKRIRGERGTSVKLRVIREGTQDLTIDIVRDLIKIPSVEWSIKEDTIGYMKISRFSADTNSLARKAAAEFTAAGVKSVILDLRGDPGGELSAAVDVASLWLKPGDPVLFEKRDGKTIKTYSAKGGNSLTSIHTVVLINEGSASASEILAGALHDHEYAQLVGEKSYGKGSVQQLVRLNDGGVLKVTIARWFTPKDKNIDKEGISPDIEVKRTNEDFAANRDPQLDKALELSR